MRRTLAAGVLAGLVACWGSPAWGATALTISDVVVDAGVRSMDMTVSATGLPAGSGLDPASVHASADGRTLPVASVTATQTATAEPPKVMVVVDTSGSMAGQPMSDAREAISTFAAQAPAGVRLGVLSFSTAPRLLVAPTLDRPRVLGAVSGLQAQGETSLYDAVLAGVAAVGTEGDRRVVVLSDGGDTRSRASLEQALTQTRASGVAVDAIGFNTGESVQAVLTRIAGAGRGRVHAAFSSAELASALSTSVRTHATALAVRVLVPQDLRGERALEVTATTPQGRLTAGAQVSLGAPAVHAASPQGWWGTQDALLVGLACIALGLALTCLVLLSGKGGTRRTHELLERYTTTARAPVEDKGSPSAIARTALELADRVVTKRKMHERSTLRLERAAVSLTPAEWLLLQAGSAFGLTLLLVLLGKSLLFAMVVGALLGTLVPRAYLGLRGSRRRRAFEEQLPDALQMTAGSLSAGYSLAQALDGLVREGSEPMATEIGRALAESRLGVPVEATLEGVSTRMGSKDFSWVVMAIRVQREVGGNLGGVLTTVGATMRERAALRRHVRGLSAEGRLSAYILVALPLLLVAYMYTIRREYLQPLYTTGVGIGLIAIAVLLMAVGSFLMSRMVKVEV